jgi:hypothetical protein
MVMVNLKLYKDYTWNFPHPDPLPVGEGTKPDARIFRIDRKGENVYNVANTHDEYLLIIV